MVQSIPFQTIDLSKENEPDIYGAITKNALLENVTLDANGKIDFKRILAEKKLSGMQYYYVEQDACVNETPLEAILISHKGLANIGFK